MRFDDTVYHHRGTDNIGRFVLILDAAGRLHVDEEMMGEIAIGPVVKRFECPLIPAH